MTNDNNHAISPVFLSLSGLCIYSAYTLYSDTQAANIWAFIYITSGWIVSLSLHEFGHAFTAYKFGDFSVAEKGYLTLNPLKYTNLFLSLVLPVVFLMMGGIGFPGGAVYINHAAIKTAAQKSLVSAAGPAATALFAALLLIPFIDGSVDLENHYNFWAATSLLAFLQVSALFLNLLPVPSLDGYGIIEPFMKDSFRKKIRNVAGIAVLIIFFLLFSDTFISDLFWSSIAAFIRTLGVDFSLIIDGYNNYKFWG
jgi:Zn-dependent protease